MAFGVSGAHGTPLVPARETVDLIHEARARGVRVFDTAPAYGAGEAERRLGRALAGMDRDAVCVSTKAGVTSRGLRGRRRDFSPDAIETSLRASLDRLGLEGVDVLFLHGADPAELTPGLIERLDRLKDAGAFARLGATGRGAELDAALDTGRIDALMTPVHPFLDAGGEARLVRAAEAGVSVFAIETAGPGRTAIRLPRRPADLYAVGRGLLASGGDDRRVPVAEGLAAALARPEVAVAVFTTTRRAHLIENAAVAG
ncbi:aldo/keto reductase [Marinicauda salina]|uniref:aldo/keto reductase n=1 Tax=Marinicauda salina TaxID=2135793 RepID=UPI0022B91A9B|nr:aldo/keto reductase [Marinicauda salina]